MIKVVFVDDSEETLEALRLQYSILPDFHVLGTYSSPDVILQDKNILVQADWLSLDIQIRDRDGIEVCQEIRREFPDLFIVICSLDSSLVTRTRATEAGCSYFHEKPLDMFQLQESLRCYERKLKRKLENKENHRASIEQLLDLL